MTRSILAFRVIFVAWLASFAASPAMADAPTVVAAGNVSGYHEHDGFYLRLASGMGPSKHTISADGSTGEISGTGGVTSLAIGGAIAKNLILNVDVFGSRVDKPELKIDGTSVGHARDSVMAATAGVGLTYYIMPVNVYVAGSVGLATVSSYYADGKMHYSSGNGWGMNLMAGKEWWVSANWGLGIAGQLIHSVVPDKDGTGATTYDLKTTAFGVLFSATYN